MAASSLFTMLCIVACEQRSTESEQVPAIQIEDALGRSISLERPAQRIASLSPSTSEALYAVGCGARIVLRDRTSDYPTAVRSLPATDPFRLSVEHIAGFAPDLVLLSHMDATRVGGLDAIGLRTAVFNPLNVLEGLRDLIKIGTLCGQPKIAAALVDELRNELGQVEWRLRGVSQPGVYVELDGSDPLKPWTVGSRSLVTDVLRRAGGRNIFADLSRTAVQVSAESILQRMPDVIVLAGLDGSASERRYALSQRPGWQSIVRRPGVRIVTSVDPALFTRPGPRLVEGVWALAQQLHPERLMRRR